MKKNLFRPWRYQPVNDAWLLFHHDQISYDFDGGIYCVIIKRKPKKWDWFRFCFRIPNFEYSIWGSTVTTKKGRTHTLEEAQMIALQHLNGTILTPRLANLL